MTAKAVARTRTTGKPSKVAPAGVDAASTELNRELNRDLLLELIRVHEPVARVELAELSRLRNSTVSYIVEQLLKEGWIVEGQSKATARGRPPTMLSLNTAVAFLVAEIHPGHAHVGLVDLRGTLVERATLPLASDGGVEPIAAEMKRLRAAEPKRRIEGVGLCVPGRVDPGTGNVLVSPNLRLGGHDLRVELSRLLRLPVELENDANACLLAELWFGDLKGAKNAVLLAISDGVGAALLTDGYLIKGHLGLAGEFGHIAYDPRGPVCGCGRSGCWEVYASSRAALRSYREAKPDADQIGYAALCALAMEGDAPARQAIERQAVAIGRGLRMVTASLAPERIIFAGEVALSWPIAEALIQAECERGLLGGTGPQLVRSRFGEGVQLLGAAAVVLQRHAGYYRAPGVETI